MSKEALGKLANQILKKCFGGSESVVVSSFCLIVPLVLGHCLLVTLFQSYSSYQGTGPLLTRKQIVCFFIICNSKK